MSTPLVIVGDDLTVLQSEISATKSVTLGPATSTDSVGGTSVARWQWTLLYKPPGSRASIRAASQNTSTCIIDNIDTWGNYRVHLWTTDSYGVSSESRPERSPNGAFAIIRVTATATKLEKLAAGERNWVERYNAIVSKLDSLSTSNSSFDDLDTLATRLQMDELVGGSETRLHKHSSSDLPVATQVSPGLVLLGDAPNSGASPRVSTQDRGAWTGHFSTTASEATPGAGGDFYRLVFYTQDGCDLHSVICAAEVAGASTAHVYEVRKMTGTEFVAKDDTTATNLLATVNVKHTAASDDGKPGYHCHKFNTRTSIPADTFVVVIMRGFGTTASSVVQATGRWVVGNPDETKNESVDIDGGRLRLVSESGGGESVYFSSFPLVEIHVADYTNAASEAVTLRVENDQSTATLIDFNGFSNSDDFTITVPTDAGGTGAAQTVRLTGADATGSSSTTSTVVAIGVNSGPSAGTVAETVVDAINGFFGSGGAYNHAFASANTGVNTGVVGVTASLEGSTQVKLVGTNGGTEGNAIVVTAGVGDAATTGTLSGGLAHFTITEGVNWIAGVSNSTTAESLKNAINGNDVNFDAYIPPVSYAANQNVVVVRNKKTMSTDGNGAKSVLARNNGSLTFRQHSSSPATHSSPYSFTGGYTGHVTPTENNESTATLVINYINSNFAKFTAAMGAGSSSGQELIFTSVASANARSYGAVRITGNPAAGQAVTIISTDTTTKTYTGVSGSSDYASNTFDVRGTYTAAATELENAIEHSSGHAGKIIVSRTLGTLILAQSVAGEAGNTAITENMDNTTVIAFDGGGVGSGGATSNSDTVQEISKTLPSNNNTATTNTGTFTGGLDASAGVAAAHHITLNWRKIY